MKQSSKIIISILASLMLCVNCALSISDALKIKVLNGTYTDETVVRFLPTATPNFDGSWDAYKLFNSSAVIPAIYTRIDTTTELSINALPALTEKQDIALHTHIKVTGTYTFQAIALGTGFPSGTGITLEDLTTGLLYNFKGGSSVTFQMTANSLNSAPRFIIHIEPPLNISTVAATCSGSSDGIINIHKAGNLNWDYQLVNQTGNIVAAAASSTDTASILNVQAGTYSLYTSSMTTLTDTTIVTIAAPLPVVAAFSSPDTILAFTTVVFNNQSVNAAAYTWDFGDGSVSDSLSPGHSFNLPGIYSVSLTSSDSNGCSSFISKDIIVEQDISTGIDLENTGNAVEISVSGMDLNINVVSKASSKSTLFVYNTAGRLITERSFTGSAFSERIHLVSAGTYIIRAVVNQKLYTKKIIALN
ncbi:MAG TPA: PKD domain-containing protein [Bacteroidia bacterium]|jgi:PKD repeat protein